MLRLRPSLIPLWAINHKSTIHPGQNFERPLKTVCDDVQQVDTNGDTDPGVLLSAQTITSETTSTTTTTHITKVRVHPLSLWPPHTFSQPVRCARQSLYLLHNLKTKNSYSKFQFIASHWWRNVHAEYREFSFLRYTFNIDVYLRNTLLDGAVQWRLFPLVWFYIYILFLLSLSLSDGERRNIRDEDWEKDCHHRRRRHRPRWGLYGFSSSLFVTTISSVISLSVYSLLLDLSNNWGKIKCWAVTLPPPTPTPGP